MSSYTTLYITRSKAKNLLLESIMGDLCDSALESFMNTILQGRLCDCWIVEDNYEFSDDHIL